MHWKIEILNAFFLHLLPNQGGHQRLARKNIPRSQETGCWKKGSCHVVIRMVVTFRSNVTVHTVSVSTKMGLRSMALGRVSPMAMLCVVPILVRLKSKENLTILLRSYEKGYSWKRRLFRFLLYLFQRLQTIDREGQCAMLYSILLYRFVHDTFFLSCRSNQMWEPTCWLCN